MPAAARSARTAVLRRAFLLAAALPLVAACSGGSPAARPTVTVTAVASASPTGSATASPSANTSEPGLVAVTAAGALVKLDPSTGAITQTLVPGGVLGDEISVSPDGSTVYFTEGSGACDRTVASVPISGGGTTSIAQGELPAISPDGTKLAFAREPM